MNKYKIAKAAVLLICIALTVFVFFAKDFILYDFNNTVSNYNYEYTKKERPVQVVTNFWFDINEGRDLYYGYSESIDIENVKIYAMTAEDNVIPVTENAMKPINGDFIGYFEAVLPVYENDIDNDGTVEKVHDFARVDVGFQTFGLEPREFNIKEIPFELAFAERKYIQVFFENRLLKDSSVTVYSKDGKVNTYQTDKNGWIRNFPIGDMRSGFTVSYSPDENNIYRMNYVIEDYNYFTPHFWEAHIPLLLIIGLSVLGIIIFQIIRNIVTKKNPEYKIYSRNKLGFSGRFKNSSSKFILLRWWLLLFSFFFWTYAGKLIEQGQLFNQIAIPVFSCPFNLDKVFESCCYYVTHLPILFTRNGTYIILFIVTLLFFMTFFGRILCGFMCPFGLIQDITDKIRQLLHIKPINVNERMNKIIQPLKWIWTVLFIGFAFGGGDFCDICPNKVFSSALGGYWFNELLGGFITVILLIGSFFIRRFWCLMCPMGFILGFFSKFNIFKLKKDCTACT